MPSVQELVERRRRQRLRRQQRARRLTVLALVAVVSSSAGVLVARGHNDAATATPAPKGDSKQKPKQSKQPKQKAETTVAPEPLLSGRPAHHVFSPELGAKAAIVVDAATGKVLWALRPHQRLPVASLTKIMTATLVLERLPLDTVVHIDWTVPRVPLVREGLRIGEEVPAWKLLYGLMLYSGNDDALALAIATAGGRNAFLALMNRQAATLGLRNSHFTSPSGVIDEENYSSAWDMAALTRYALRDARFRAIVRTRVKRVSWAAPTYAKTYVNKNGFLTRYPGANGVKTGWTTLSGPCIAVSATRRGRTLIAVVINSPRKYNDAARLLNLGYSLPG
jgi:D-alanyl-D-alanine carboxypeptidase (penicillin-binding protein 5/6)